MATLANDSYSAASGGSIHAGRFALPTWRPVPGTVAAIGLNTLSDVDPDPGRTHDYALMMGQNGLNAWNTSNYAPNLGAMGSVVYAGAGGHGDYSGTEIYRFDVATRTWSRPTDPVDFTLPLVEGDHGWDATWTDFDVGGSKIPCSTHTYDYPRIIPPGTLGVGAAGGILSPINMEAPLSGDSAFKTHILDLATYNWVRSTGNDAPYSASPVNGGSCLDLDRNRLIMAHHNQWWIHCMDLTTMTWTIKDLTNVNGFGEYTFASQVDPVFPLMLTPQRDGNIRAIDVSATGNWTWVTLTLSGDALWDVVGGSEDVSIGIEYIASIRKYVMYHRQAHTNILFWLTPPASNPLSNAWAVERETFTGSMSIGAYDYQGKRFCYCPPAKCFLFHMGTSSPMYAITSTKAL